MKCEYCNKSFYDKSSIKKHQSSKSCVKNLNSDVNIVTFTCQYCNKKLSSKQSLKRHDDTCKEKDKLLSNQDENTLKNIVKQLQEEVKELKDGKTTIVNNINNTVNNITINNNIDFISFMTERNIKETFDK